MAKRRKTPTPEEIQARNNADAELRAKHHHALNWTDLQEEIRADYAKRKRPVIVFPSRDAKIAWLAEGARTGETPPLPEGAYYE